MIFDQNPETEDKPNGRKKEYKIKVQGQLIPVNEEVYFTYYRMKRRELHLEEKDMAHGVFSYNALDTEGTNGEDTIPDLVSPRVEDIVMNKLTVDTSSISVLLRSPKRNKR